MATIFIFLLVANWMELIPGVDSIGLMHHPEPGINGHRVAEIGSTGIYYLDVSTNLQEKSGIAPMAGEASTGEVANEAPCGVGDICVVTPFVRAAATDLNLTLALAIIAVIAVQVFGVEALGFGYFAKFINTPALEHGGMGYMDFVVGLLEIISELAKIISLAFRLFGNIFAGQVLLFVLAFLIPYLLPIPFFALEIFVGAMQAFVFAMLMLVFASMAMIPHHAEEEGAH